MDGIITREDAKATDLKHFFTGVPCKWGHVDLRFVSSKECLTCNRIRMGRRSKTKRSFYEKNYRRTEAYKQTQHRYYLRHKTKILEKVATFAATPRGIEVRRRAINKWKKTDNGQLSVRYSDHKRRAIKRGVRSSFTKEDELKLRSKQRKCHICGHRFTKSDPATLDHVIALANGGEHIASNIALAHLSCNLKKNSRITHLL